MMKLGSTQHSQPAPACLHPSLRFSICTAAHMDQGSASSVMYEAGGSVATAALAWGHAAQATARAGGQLVRLYYVCLVRAPLQLALRPFRVGVGWYHLSVAPQNFWEQQSD